MELILPCDQYKDQFLDTVRAFKEEGVTGFWLSGQGDEFDYNLFMQIDQDRREGKNLLPRWVRATTYWLIDNDQFIGHTNIRHELDDYWIVKNGNIGYHIAPQHRRKGYGKKILALALDKCRDLGMEKALLTCDDNNIGSGKVIEANGGVLENIVTMSCDGEKFEHPCRRYWIAL